jgi:methionine-rich copper-binding protein CopC/putative copper export protein/ABC-type branched-subunit amino acid transport system substrate-binding protein
VTPRTARAVVFLVTIAAATAMAPSASAHPYLVRADPAPGSTLSAAPKELQLLFTERLDGPYCTVVLVDAGGRRHPTAVHVTGTSLVTDVGNLALGPYRVEWSVIGDDGHRVEGDYGLAVGHGSAGVAAVAGRASEQAPGAAATRAVLVALDMALAAVVIGLVVLRSGDENRRPRSIFIARTLWGAAVAVAVIALVQVWTGAVWSTVTGRLALERLLATLALFPVALGLIRRPRLRTAYAAVAVVGLLLAVALSSHAFAASSGRTAQVAVLTAHLVAASVWLGAIIAVVAGTPARRLAVPVVASIAVVVGTGVFNAHVQLGPARELLSSAYGRVLDVKVALVVLMIAAGMAAIWRRWEAVTAVGVLTLAGVLGQLPNPVSVPAFSQRHPLPVGSTIAMTSTGDTLVAVALSPGRPGLNRLVASLQRPDSNDVPIPVAGAGPIEVTGTCACGEPSISARLLPVGGSASVAGPILLPRAARWTVHLVTAQGAAVADLDVSPKPNHDEIVVGVPADLSGPDAGACQDQVVGLQVAAAEVNERGVAGGKAVRVVALDDHGRDPAAAVGALRSVGARLLTMPCGPPEAESAVQRAASAAGIPVIGGADDAMPWSWPTVASPAVEGTALARQIIRQGGQRPMVVVGHGTREQQVAAAVGGPPPLIADDPTATAARIREANPDIVVFSLSAGEAPPLLRALAAVGADWGPAHGALASSSMMSATVVTTGGDWFKEGRVSLASEVDPSDGSSLDYASRLQQLFPGSHPSIDGVRGYIAGWLIANVLHRAPDASPSAVRHVLAHDLRSFVFGPTHLRWDGADGGAQSMAFFQTVFTNPLALAGLPGQVGHAGVFLGQGAFVQVTPWSDR